MDLVQCTRCGGWYPEIFYQIKERGVSILTPTRRNICRGCQQTNKDEKKKKNRPLAKARDTYRNHADKFMKSKLDKDGNICPAFIQSPKELESKYGWNIHQMTHDIEHASHNGCKYCLRLFSTMGHGLADITLEIIDRDREPYYATNVSWVCRTCNTEKGMTSPDNWGAILQAWKNWRERQNIVNGYWVGPLFEENAICV